jgi:hypothetical protein
MKAAYVGDTMYGSLEESRPPSAYSGQDVHSKTGLNESNMSQAPLFDSDEPPDDNLKGLASAVQEHTEEGS